MPPDIIVKYRITRNKWNLADPPWPGAIGIEEVQFNQDGSEILAVPPIVFWVTRGNDQLPGKIVELLNSDAGWLAERAKHAA